MKKLIVTFCMIGLIIAGTLGGISAFAYVSLEDCDRCFQATMNALLNKSDVDDNKITAVRNPVYDLHLEMLGYIYEYEIASGNGYAVIICDDGNYVAQEVMPHSENPYKEVAEAELCVYVNTMSYYKAVDGVICDIQTNTQVTDEMYAVLEENAVFYKTTDYYTPEYVSVTVSYVGDPVEDYYPMSYRSPMYYVAELESGCAAIAGGNVVGYFDRYYEDLIPNHEAGSTAYGYYFYNVVDDSVKQVIRTLYSNMNGTSAGITETNFKSGLQKYCSNLGYTCDFTSLMTSGKLNYDLVKSSMKSNKPVVLFLSTYNICDIHFFTQKDVLDYEKYTGNHVMVGFGYRDITYTLTSGGTSHYKFIYVATGIGNSPSAYFNIDYATNINSSYGVNIH